MNQPVQKPGLWNKFIRRFQSVRLRLSLWYVSILVLVLVAFGVVIYSVTASSLSSGIDGQLRFVGEQLPLVVVSGPDRFDVSEQVTGVLQALSEQKIPEQALNQLQGIPALRLLVEGRYLLVLVDGQGKITRHFGAISEVDLSRLPALVSGTGSQNGITDFSVAPDDGRNPVDYRLFYTKIQRNGNTAGTVILGLEWDGAATLRSLLLTLLLSGSIILVLAAGGGYWLAGRAMGPVQAITRTARQINDTDLSRRLNLKRQDELGELSATFDLMLDRLQDSFERQRQFTADASHELRTPLTIINLEVSRLLAREHKVEDYRQALGVIRVENEYMSGLVNDLLELARADTGRFSLNRELLDLSDIALEVIERFEPLAHAAGLRLIAGSLPELPVEGDRLYLTRMLANLVENALKYTAGTGTQVQVECGSQPVQGEMWAWVRVADNGPGIAPEYLPHLFERFYQVDKSRSGEGRSSGLGLAIVQWIVQVHGGRVEVTSQENIGTTFVVYLPGVKK